ncbi:phage tail protein [Streptomyces sp. NPDC055036]
MAGDDPDLTGRVRLDLSGLVSGLRFAQAVTRRQIGRLVDDANRRLRGMDTSGLTAGLGRVTGMIGGLGRLAAPFAAAGAAVGSLVPLIASVASALAQLAPAAALAVSGFLAIGLAVGTMKLAMSGVGDAVKAALDPSDPEAYAAALEGLAPAARSFVGVIREMQPAFESLQQAVQQRVFSGFDKQLQSTGRVVLPTLRNALLDTAGTLNAMGKGVLGAARDLGKSGTLGTALKGATDGLHEFRRAPGQVVTALGQIGAAAAPAFRRVSAAGGSALDRLSAKISKAFESGGMERAIEQAINLFAQLGRVAGNIGGILGNVFGGLTASGQGLFGTLEQITGALKDATATPGFQRALQALSQTMGVVAQTVAPLLGKALGILGPIIEALAGPAQQLVRTLGDGLSRVMTALGPVLVAVAGAVGDLVVALLPIIDLAADLVVALLPALVPLFQNLGLIIQQLAPFIQQLAANIAAQLVPILSAIGPILSLILPQFVELAERLFPLLTETLLQLHPSLLEISTALAGLLISLAPVIAKFLEFQVTLLDKLIPAVQPVINIILKLVTRALTTLADIITRFIIPTINILVALLNGDFRGAFRGAMAIVSTMTNDAKVRFEDMRRKAVQVVTGMVTEIPAAGRRMALGFATAIISMAADATKHIQGLPGRIRSAFPSAEGILRAAGQGIIRGLISGIQSMVPSLSGVLSGITSRIPDWKGPKKKDASLLTPAGKSIITGLITGIDASTASLKSKLNSVTTVIQRAISINSGNRNKVSGLGSLLSRVAKDNARLLSLAKTRDTVAAKLKTAQKALDDAVKARSKAAADFTSGILGEANITTGFSLVNSVTAITVGLQQAVNKTQAFAANLAKLKAAGLRGDLLGQIADAGVDGGAATAEALARATPAELKKINDLQAQLAKAAGTAGNTAAGALYDAGVKAAQGLVDGLKRQQGAIESQMKKIADAMVKAMKKALKMRSPSRRARDIGVQFMEGMPLGFEAMRSTVARSAASVANAAATAASGVAAVVPSIPAPGQLTAAYAGTAGGGDTTNNFYLSGGEASPDGILRALSWRGLVGRR